MAAALNLATEASGAVTNINYHVNLLNINNAAKLAAKVSGELINRLVNNLF